MANYGIPVLKEYMSQVAEIPLLTKEEEISLARELSKHDGSYEETRSKFIKSNLKLVVKIANIYRDRGLDLMDLIQEGNIGLMRAVEGFDYRRGRRFSTYAGDHIKSSMKRAIANQSKTIRTPIKAQNILFKLKREKERIIQEKGREPTIEELASEINISPKEIEFILNISKYSVNLDTYDKDGYAYTSIIDERSIPPEREIDIKIIKEKLREVFEKYLTENEKSVLILKYLSAGSKYVLREIAEFCGKSKARIGQIQAKGIRKMQVPDRLKELTGCL